MKLRKKKEEQEEAVLSDLILCGGEVHMQHCFLVFLGPSYRRCCCPPCGLVLVFDSGIFFCQLLLLSSRPILWDSTRVAAVLLLLAFRRQGHGVIKFTTAEYYYCDFTC